jgi:hypothetical protein
LDIGNTDLADAHLGRKYVSHREFSNEVLTDWCDDQGVDVADSVLGKIKLIIINKLLN